MVNCFNYSFVDVLCVLGFCLSTTQQKKKVFTRVCVLCVFFLFCFFTRLRQKIQIPCYAVVYLEFYLLKDLP